MKKFEKNYKSAFDKINISSEDLEDIRYTICKNKHTYKLKYALISIIVVCFCFTTVVFGKEIANKIKGFIWENGVVELPNSEEVKINAHHTKLTETIEIKNENPFDEKTDKDIKFDHDEIEDRLGIKILKNPYINKYIINTLNYNDSKCSTISFDTAQEDYYKQDDYWYIQIRFMLRTQYASEKEKNQSYGISTKGEIKKYYIKNLDVNADVHLFQTTSQENSPAIATANFIYNGIAYSVRMMKRNYKAEDLYNILESFTYDN